MGMWMLRGRKKSETSTNDIDIVARNSVLCGENSIFVIIFDERIVRTSTVNKKKTHSMANMDVKTIIRAMTIN